MAYVCKTFYMSYYDMLKHLFKPNREKKRKKNEESLDFRKCFHTITDKNE